MTPREVVDRIESGQALPGGSCDRFAGYAVMGLPFRSGHVLALRRFPASSIGPGFTTVWHRDPRGLWTFHSTVDPEFGCSRYFGGAVTQNVIAPVEIEWKGPAHFTVNVAATLSWEIKMADSLSTHLLNGLGSLVPESWWQSKFVLRAVGMAARVTLRAGKVNLTGMTPNGQRFIANPRQIWLIESSHATVNGLDLGPVGPLARQARLNDFLIPQRGLFAVARGFMESPATNAWRPTFSNRPSFPREAPYGGR